MIMTINESLKKRRSIYALGKDIPVSDDEVISLIKETTELTPDAFNMKSPRVVVALGENQDKLWDTVYDAFGGQVAREKIDGFKKAHGTILYFYDNETVQRLQKQFPLYADNFPIWAQQTNGMLQISIWTALRELNIGANLQHYNPVIDDAVKKLFDIPEQYVMVGQMPFGSIEEEPEPKEKEDINQRVIIKK